MIIEVFGKACSYSKQYINIYCFCDAVEEKWEV